MEFLDLGKHCSESTCKQLDFLPLKCDACEDVFCKDHITYDQHKCASAYKKNMQVPVCPLCSAPVPVKRGEMPDLAVGRHIDRNCSSDLSSCKKKIFTNRCLKPGCKKKELMEVLCDQCHNNFCLSHRHPLDHDCRANGRLLSKAGHAALNRSLKFFQKENPTEKVTCRMARIQPSGNGHLPQESIHIPLRERPDSRFVDFQNEMSEDEALKKALELSLLETGIHNVLTLSHPEDDELAHSSVASREEYRTCRLKGVKATGK
ncbi:AN1-type zinc finger protein 2A [Spea bombifrons]|uniref:AN1-type zinc finger protein 2A n=1 Tax=Spea bombifrons TaxID=233779 RepID=UPI00234AA210|nr:AN1-type zinc finger protein 2A [Spea bombifrons]